MRQYCLIGKTRSINELYLVHPLAYISWRAMRDRIINTDRLDYQYYGGRGITICERWKNFENFLNDMGDPPIILGIRYTLDRKDNNGNYEKDNCRWSSPII